MGNREVRADDPATSTTEPSDCGTFSLYYLLAMTGHPKSIEDVRAALPGRDERGYSLKELTEGASRLGLEVSGIRMRDARVPPDRPMIAFLNREGHGHYVAIRPVGHTGTLVQLLDGRERPDVLDLSTFTQTHGWTGLGLIPAHERSVVNLGLVLAFAALAVWALRHWISVIRPTRRPPSSSRGRSGPRSRHRASSSRG